MWKPDNIRLAVEVGSAMAVALTLGLVALELRAGTEQAALNTRAVEVAAYQDLIAQISEINRINVENPDMNELRSRALRGDSLSDAEKLRMNAYWYLVFRHGDMAFYQFQRGVLSGPRLLAVLGPLRQQLHNPTFPETWEQRRESFAPEYVSFVDSLFEAR
jgi:hypothetical protein